MHDLVADVEHQQRAARPRSRPPSPPPTRTVGEDGDHQTATPISRSIESAMNRVPMPRERERELHAFRRGDRAAILILHGRCASDASHAAAPVSAERFAAERARRGPSSRRRCSAPATGPRGSAPTACAGSASSTARGRRPRLRAPPLSRRAADRAAGVLVLRARAAVYSRAGRRASLWEFLRAATGGGSPSGRCSLLVAWTLLLAPAWLGAVWGLVDAPAAAGLIPADFQSAADPPVEGRDFDAADGLRVLVPGDVQQHPGHAGRLRGRHHVRRC